MFHKCEILIPQLYGKRRIPVEEEVLLKFIQIFNVQFGGSTALGQTGVRSIEGRSISAGTWTNPKTGEVEDDVCWLFRIYVKPELVENFRRIAIEIGAELEQEEMLIDIGPATGQFLKVVGGMEADEIPEPSIEQEDLENNDDHAADAAG